MRLLAVAALTLLAFPGVAAAQQVGVTAAVNQSATSLAPSQKPRIVQLGDQVIHDEKISTDGKGLLQILLVDGTTFTVGPNSTMTIDKFVYDPDAGTAQVVATLSKGAFRFIGGKSSKSPDGVTLNTPVGTVGVRGGISNLDFTNATAYHIDMVYGDGVTLKDGTKIIGNLYHSGYSIVIGANGKVEVEKTPPEWGKTFQALMTGNGGQGGGKTVQSEKVETALNQTNTNAASEPPGGNQPPDNGQQQVANTANTDGDKVTSSSSQEPPDDNPPPNDNPPPPNEQFPITSLAQIQNSDLANVTAIYDGIFAAVLNEKGDTAVLATATNIPFELQYGFATGNGTATWGNADGTIEQLHNDPSLQLPVTASDPSHTGLAGFGYSGPVDFGTGPAGATNATATVQGYFLNAPDGTGRGVAGIFQSQLDTPFAFNPDSPTAPPGTKTYEITGAFGANLTGTSPSPTP